MVVKLREPTIPITEVEQSAFCRTDEGLESKTLLEEFSAGVRWQKLPTSYMRIEPDELGRRIQEAKATLGQRLVVLGHHYQRDEVIRFADYRGDSLKLSQFAASQKDAEYIIFCGVHFMAETASILSGPEQRVILPNLTAGCSMADMAHVDDVLDCWDDLVDVLGREQRNAHHVHELDGGHQGVVRAERRDRLHFVERAGHVPVGAGEGQEDTVPTRPAPRAEHRPEDGDRPGRDDRLEPVQAVGRSHRGGAAAGQGYPLAGALLGAYEVHGRADRGGPPEVP